MLVNPEAQYLLDFVKSWRPERTLEIGCARGTEAKLLEDLTEIHGVDIDPSAIEEARKSVKGFFKVADGSKLPYDDSTFNLVYSSGGVIAHNPPSAVGSILDEMFRVGKKILLIEYMGTRTSPSDFTNVKKGCWIHDIELLMVGRVYTPIISKVVPVGLDRFWIFACDKGIVNVQARAIDIEAKLERTKVEVLTKVAVLQGDVALLVKIATAPMLGRVERLKKWIGM